MLEINKIRNDGVTTFCVNREIMKQIIDVAPNKVLSLDFIFSLTTRQRKLLIETMIAGDGSYGGRNRNIPQYFQKDKAHVDTFLILCTLAGITTHTAYREGETKFGLSKGYEITLTSKTFSFGERVDMHGARRTQGGSWKTKKNIPTIPYKGKVWCPTTDYGTFVCRRGSKIYVTGNSYIEDMKAEARLALCQVALKFDPRKSRNPFGYYTTIVHRCFLTFMEREKLLRDIRDDLIVIDDMMHGTGLKPSMSRQMEDIGGYRTPDQEIDTSKLVERA